MALAILTLPLLITLAGLILLHLPSWSDANALGAEAAERTTQNAAASVWVTKVNVRDVSLTFVDRAIKLDVPFGTLCVQRQQVKQ